MIRSCGNTKPELTSARLDPLARLPHRLVRQPDDREGGQPAPEVDLDPHPPGLDAVDGEGVDPGQAHQNAPSRWSRRTRRRSASSTTPIASKRIVRRTGADVTWLSQTLRDPADLGPLGLVQAVPRDAATQRGAALTSQNTSDAVPASDQVELAEARLVVAGERCGSRGARSARRRAARPGGRATCGRRWSWTATLRRRSADHQATVTTHADVTDSSRSRPVGRYSASCWYAIDWKLMRCSGETPCFAIAARCSGVE